VIKPILLNIEPFKFSKIAKKMLQNYFDYREATSESLIKQELPGACVLLTRLGYNLNKDFLCNAKKLKYVVTPTTGTNHIDEVYLTRIGANVVSLKGEIEFLKKVTPTAEHTWGLLLALLRDYKYAFQDVENYRWRRDDFKGSQIKGKTIGIVGMGRLGEMVAKYASAFGMEVIFSDICQIKSHHRQVSFLELLKNSDVVSIHVPLDNTTRGLFSYEEFSIMKSTAIILNTSRGDIIDDCALLDALENKKLSGAGLDVLKFEEDWGLNVPTDHALIGYAKRNSNLIITPHIGGACPEVMRLAEEFISKKLIDTSCFE
jgi:D-3-phosphoglycerate dehydrogenase / 2-oxoglutarate reductase